MGSTYPTKHSKQSDKGQRPQGAGILPHGKPGKVAPKGPASPTQHGKRFMINGQWVES